MQKIGVGLNAGFWKYMWLVQIVVAVVAMNLYPYLKPVRKLPTANDVCLPANILEKVNRAVVNTLYRAQQAEHKLQGE